MNLVRRFIAVLMTLAFFMSSTLAHSHSMAPAQAGGAAHHAVVHHDDVSGHAHHHHGKSGSDSRADMPLDCCSMGGCAFVEMTAPMRSQRVAVMVVFVPPVPVSRSLVTVPEAPPPRRIG